MLIKTTIIISIFMIDFSFQLQQVERELMLLYIRRSNRINVIIRSSRDNQFIKKKVGKRLAVSEFPVCVQLVPLLYCLWGQYPAMVGMDVIETTHLMGTEGRGLSSPV